MVKIQLIILSRLLKTYKNYTFKSKNNEEQDSIVNDNSNEEQDSKNLYFLPLIRQKMQKSKNIYIDL